MNCPFGNTKLDAGCATCPDRDGCTRTLDVERVIGKAEELLPEFRLIVGSPSEQVTRDTILTVFASMALEPIDSQEEFDYLVALAGVIIARISNSMRTRIPELVKTLTPYWDSLVVYEEDSRD